eukprot:740134-Pelagomonas_calceolata.AAC.1
MQNVNRFRLRAHSLIVETASWEDGNPPVCDRCSCGQIQDEAHVLFMCRYEGLCALRQKYSKFFWTLSGDSSPAHPFFLHQPSVQAVSNFLLQSNKKLFYFMSVFWICCWLAWTSHRLISRAVWLKAQEIQPSAKRGLPLQYIGCTTPIVTSPAQLMHYHNGKIPTWKDSIVGISKTPRPWKDPNMGKLTLPLIVHPASPRFLNKPRIQGA